MLCASEVKLRSRKCETLTTFGDKREDCEITFFWGKEMDEDSGVFEPLDC